MTLDLTCTISTTAHKLPFSVRQDSGWVGTGVTDPVGSRDPDLRKSVRMGAKSYAPNPDPVGGLLGGDNGELFSTNATFSETDAHTESTPTAENPVMLTAGSEAYFPYLVKFFGYGVNGGRLMGFFIGDMVLELVTSSSDGGM